MWQYKRLTICLILLGLCFVCIPIKLTINKDQQLHIDRFLAFIETYNKSYKNDTEEYQRRYNSFMNSLDIIEKLNSMRIHNESATFGITQFSDLSEDEFLANILMQRRLATENLTDNFIIKEIYKNENVLEKRNIPNINDLPLAIDWRKSGTVSAVRAQGKCGACWAHSIIGTVESLYAIANNSTTINLSVQQMIDCARNKNNGCKGGDICNLLQWLYLNKINIEYENYYNELPTKNKNDNCKINRTVENVIQPKKIGIKDFSCRSYVEKEYQILNYLAHHGPVAAVVNALLWQNYIDGIIQFHCNGQPVHINHAVEIVGYNLNGIVPYYIVRNSWGSNFGDDGYLKIEIGKNLCGIANQVAMIRLY